MDDDPGIVRRYLDQPEEQAMIALASKFWIMASVGVGLWAASAHAQDMHNGPVAIRPMVTAPSLVGRTPPILPHCPAERRQLKQTLQAALNDKGNHRGTPGQIRARWREADEALATSTNVMDNSRQPTYCDEALQGASEYVLGD
jgi:hypothetical protein